MALARGYRLQGSHTVTSVFESGKTVVRGSFFFIRCLSRNDATNARIAVIVSKSSGRTAVRRNMIRRIYSDLAFVHKLYTLSADLVIVATQSIVGKGKREIKGDFERNIKRLFVHPL